MHSSTPAALGGEGTMGVYSRSVASIFPFVAALPAFTSQARAAAGHGCFGRTKLVAVVWLTLASALGCGAEPALNGSETEPATSASIFDESTTPLGESSGVVTSGDSETSSSDAQWFMVPPLEAAEEVTQVYDGETHLVADARATLRAESSRIAVYVQDGIGLQVTDDELEGFMRRVVARGAPGAHLPDLGILPTNELVFGALDVGKLPGGKQRVFIVDTAGAGDGYLCSWCAYPDLHLDGRLVSPIDGEQALSISAHELYHAIHRGFDADEEVWVDESLAEAAMTVNGYFTDVAWLRDYLENANQDWGPSGADVTNVHYGACLAWGTYLWEQGGQELMRAISREPANGWAGLDAALASVRETRTAWELFLELGAALYLDDAARGLGIKSFDLPIALRAAPLDGDVTEMVEAYGFLHYELTAATTLIVEGEGVSAVYVEEKAALGIAHVETNVPFDVPGPGLLVVTARSQTPVNLRVE